MKSYGFTGSFTNFKFSLISFVRTNSVKIVVLGGFTLLALLTGIFSAVKFLDGDINIIFSDFGLKEFVSGNGGSTTMFFQRMGSITVVMFFLTILSLHSSLFVVGGILIVYRTFLLGLNITFIVIMYGFGGIITGVLIMFPLQLAMLLIMIAFFVIARDRCIAKSKYGNRGGINIFFLLIMFLLLLAAVNLAETLLLLLTSAKIILII